MSKKNWHLSRRTFLRGTGVAIALPWLEAMAPRVSFGASSEAAPPVRMACLFFPNGAYPKAWTPTKAGADYDLPTCLEPLAPVKQDVLVLTGLDKAKSHDGDGHYAKDANFLTGLHVNKTDGRDISAGGISMDQLAAQRIGARTPLPSLEVGVDPVDSGVDTNVGYTRLYACYISWSAANIPVAKELNPRAVYERLFDAKERSRKSALDDDRSLLDLALEDAHDLRRKLGRDDQVKVDEYLESVRSVEKQIEFAAKPDGRRWHPQAPAALTPPPEARVKDYQKHAELMLDLIVLAFRTDQTRIASFMFANSVSNHNFGPYVDGVHGGHHEMSHHSNLEEKIRQYNLITQWHVAQFARMLQKMRDVKEGAGSLLDNSLVLCGSGMSDGNRHNPADLPILVGGRGGGAFAPGRHVASPEGTPLCNLYLSMLNAMGVNVPRFGDSTGKLNEVESAA
ncbi:MAG TPA: DUF1552 domain-containing protein [Tepidisphaeraceae bacterium]|jgi:hypothetical protein